MSSADSKPDIVQTNEPNDSGAPPEKRENASRRYILILLQAGGRRDPLGYLDRVVLQLLWRKLDAKVQGERDRTEIDVWLESAGGDAHAAYKLFLDLRSRASKIRVVVPDFAKSAATLFVLGTDEVHMGPAAELGPLDMQMETPIGRVYGSLLWMQRGLCTTWRNLHPSTSLRREDTSTTELDSLVSTC